jgi:nitroreductase
MAETEHRTAAAAGPDRDVLTAAVAAAVRAPSVYNTQPWRFAIDDRTLDVYADPDRRLPVLDPSGRDLVLSCGAAVGCARIALAGQGWASRTSAPPASADPDHLVRIEVGEHSPPSSDDVAMARAVEQRRCVRSPLTSRRVYRTHLEALLGEAVRLGVGAVALTDPGVRDDVLVLQARADAVLTADPQYREELAKWVRPGKASDGVTATPGREKTARSPRHWAQRDFSHDPTAVPHVRGPAGPDDDPLVVVLAATDDTRGRLRAGEALARVLVRATALGMVGVPMTQLAEVPTERERLRAVVGLDAQPQALIRLGHEIRPQVARPTSRRPLEEVLLPRPAA